MILLLIFPLLTLINAKSLTIIPSASFHGKDGKVDSTDFIKEPVAVEYEVRDRSKLGRFSAIFGVNT